MRVVPIFFGTGGDHSRQSLMGKVFAVVLPVEGWSRVEDESGTYG